VEQIGVRKSEENLQDADLIIYVVDSSTQLDENDRKIIQLLQGRKVIILLNKTDLQTVTTADMISGQLESAEIIAVSAKENQGIEQLEACIRDMFYQGKISFNDEIYITNVRQKNLLIQSLDSLKQVKNSIESGMPEDFFSIDLMDAYEALGKITGEQVGEDLVNEIFSKFCMGK
jgi:tRNA modification GTPase